MALQEGQVQLRDLVVGPGTPYRWATLFNPMSRSVRADQGGERPWAHGSWSGAEWAEQVAIPMRLIVTATSSAEWMQLHQQLLTAFAPSHEDLPLTFCIGGVEYLMFGRPRMVEPQSRHLDGHGYTNAAFVALDSTVYSVVEHTVTLGLPSTSGGLTLPVTTNVLNANVGFEAGLTGWTAGSGATIAISTAQAYEGSNSLLITPDGVSSSSGAYATQVPVTAGKDYIASLYAYPTLSAMTLGPAVDWYDAASGGNYMSTSIATATLVQPGAWTYLGGRVTAPAGAAGAKMRARHTNTPTASQTWHADLVQLAEQVPTGLTLPFSVDATFTAGRASIVDAGTRPAPLRLRIWGPVAGPRVSVVASGGTQTILCWLALDAGQWLDLDTANRTAYLNGVASRRGLVSGDWPTLPASATAEIAFAADAYNPDARLDVTWRDAWH